MEDLAADSDGAGQYPRLFVLSAGNTRDPNAWAAYPDSLSTNLVHDPGQAWNAVTVGACTCKLDTDGHLPLAPISAEGGLSPFTTTSWTWDGAWPLKPDIVFEGGNAAKDDFGAVWMPSLLVNDSQRGAFEHVLRHTHQCRFGTGCTAGSNHGGITRTYGPRPSVPFSCIRRNGLRPCGLCSCRLARRQAKPSTSI